jgi:hypothetical protein
LLSDVQILELDYTASAKCQYQPQRSMDSQAPKKERLMKISIKKLI